jgi:hypothetical protein
MQETYEPEIDYDRDLEEDDQEEDDEEACPLCGGHVCSTLYQDDPNLPSYIETKCASCGMVESTQ